MLNAKGWSLAANSTVATLLNVTEPSSQLISNITFIPLNSSVLNVTSINDGLPWYYNNSNYWNYTIYPYNPYCPTCYPTGVTVDPSIVTYSYTYTYIYYVLLLLLLIVAIISIKIGISRRKELERRAAAQRRRARQQAAAPYTASCNSDNNNGNNNNTEPKDFDLPPAYDEVVQSYMMAKQEQQQQQEQSGENIINDGVSSGISANQSSNNLSTTVSTLTIETELSNSNVSVINLNHIPTLDLSNSLPSQQPPLYEHTAGISAKAKNDDQMV